MRESVVTLWQELRGQRVRAALTLLAVAWGTFALLCLLAFSIGFEALFQKRQAGMGDGVAVAWPSRTTVPWRGFPAGRAVRVAHEDVRSLPLLVPGLEAASAEWFAAERLRVGSRVLRVRLSGVDADYGRLRNLAPRAGGRWLNHRDVAERRRVLFLGDRLARDLFGAAEPVGATVVLRRAPFTVVGVMRSKEQDSDYNGEDGDRAFVPSTTHLDLFGRRPVDDFVYRARDPSRQTEVTARVVAALGRRLGFDPRDLRALSVWDTTESQRMLGAIFLGFHVILGMAGTFTVLVGGVAVGQLMAWLVRRRRPEIGLKLAVGATRRLVLGEVMAQTGVLVLAGAVLGAVTAGLVLALARGTPAVEFVGAPRVPLGVALPAALLLAGVGAAAGWGPARRASRLDPVAALRS